jgi:coenzyme F420-reducing hydrogenase alpha subunit
LTFFLTACNQKDSTTYKKQGDTLTAKENIDTTKGKRQEETSKQLSFKNVTEVIQDEKSNAWVELKDSTASLALHFNLDKKDTLSVSYSPECWLMYPYKIENNKIIVYWDNIIDTKYDFDIVKAIRKIDKKNIGKPFMVLELVNDTTLKATYPIPDLIKKINNSSKKRNLFPDNFILSQEFFL